MLISQSEPCKVTFTVIAVCLRFILYLSSRLFSLELQARLTAELSVNRVAAFTVIGVGFSCCCSN